MLTLIDECTRECLAIDVARQLKHDDVLERLAWLMATRGVLEHIRSDNGTEFTAKAVGKWLSRVGVKTLYIEPISPASGVGEWLHRVVQWQVGRRTVGT